MTVLLDSNVLIDLVLESAWAGWVTTQLEAHADEEFVVNQLIYAEVSSAFARPEELEQLLDELGVLKLNIPWEAAFDAGQAYLRYRRGGGPREVVLPDFYIGAHARWGGMSLMSRDRRIYGTYFPDLDLIAPISETPPAPSPPPAR